ncbi:lamina-associated polypeptide 2-like [Dermacentor albipictus]|uniref:lamina-associated polypeptide 2-like n=1 Tax=Dermacentor albipictus TaxID=60249 RepID=UPI0031FCB2E5
MATMTKTSLREALHQKGVAVPPGSPKETLVRLYREHFPGSDTARDGLLDFSSDEEVDTKRHDTSLPVEVSEGVRSLTNDELYTKLKEFGEPVGPIVSTTRNLYEKRLQRFINSGGSPKPPTSPPLHVTFSATEDEAENDDDYEGTPLQDVPPSRIGLGTHGGVFGSFDAFEGPLTSQTSASFTGASPPLQQMSLRARTGAPGRKEEASSGNHVRPQVAQQRPRKGIPLLVKFAIAAAVVGVNLLIYANLEYFKSDVPVPSVVNK